MKNKILFIWLCLIPFSICAAQPKPIAKNGCSIDFGYQNFRMLDQNASPLIYVANNAKLAFQKEENRISHQWNLGISISIGSNQSKRFGKREAELYDHYSVDGNRDSYTYTINPGLSFAKADLYYSIGHYLADIVIKNSKSKIFIGGQIKDDFIYSGLGADTWFFNQLSILPYFRFQSFSLKKSSIRTTISTPVFSYLLRQPYTLDPSLPQNSYFIAYIKTGSDFVTLNKFQQFNLKFDFLYKLGEKRLVGMSYQFMWMNCSNMFERKLKAYSNSLSLKYLF